jgi:hypothetical protein
MGPKTDKSTTAITLDIETLNTISTRLSERADEIRQVTLVDLVADLRIASRACELLAHVRFTIGDIAQKAEDNPKWDNAVIARDLRALLDDASVAEPKVGQP